MRSLALVCAATVWACVLCAGILQAPEAHAGSDPARDWITLETEHFDVHTYDEGLELAREVAGFCEEAWLKLNPLLGWEPGERVQVVVVDDVDSSNGFASVMPYNKITILAFPPPAHSDLGDYDDWLRLLVFHEYAHIVHLDNADEVPEAFNTLFGKILKPNQSLPRWFTEGLATWVETATTGGGRVGSSRFEMVLRAGALADELLSIEQLTGAPLVLPRGTSWYLYGSYVIDHIVRNVGAKAMRDYITAYGRRLIPYGMNILARQYLGGKDLRQWFDEMLADVRARAEAVRDRVMAAGLLQGKPETTGGEFKSHPQFTRDGRHVVYVLSNGYEETRLVVAPADDLDDVTEIMRCDGGCGRFDITRDGRSVVLSTSRPHRRVNRYRELIIVPLKPGLGRKPGRQLTQAGRTRDPEVAPRGRAIWTVRSAWGRTWLESFSRVDGRSLRRWDPPGRSRMDTPHAHPDGHRLFASMHSGGSRDLIEIDLRTGDWRRLTEGASLELDLELSEDGRWLVYSSDADGVYDIYARDVSGDKARDGRTFRLTRVLTGAFEPALSPRGDRLLYVGWTWEGEEIYSQPFDPEAGVPVEDPDPRQLRQAPARFETEISEPDDYNPVASLLPRSWLPTVSADTTGLGFVGLVLTGTDASSRLTASIGAELDVARLDLSAWASLQIGLGFPDITVSLGRYSWDRFAFFGDKRVPYREEVVYGTVEADVPMPDAAVSMNFSALLTAEWRRGLGKTSVQHSPDSYHPFIPKEGLRAAFRLSWSFDDTESHTYDVGPSSGGSGKISLRVSLPELGALKNRYELTWRFKRYLRMPWLAGHSLLLSIRGGIAGGSPEDIETFNLGGVPEQDLVTAIVNQSHANAIWLRGFAPGAFSGTHHHLATVEYRFPLWRARSGIDTLPVFFRDLSMAVFTDVGLIWRGEATGGVFNGTRVGIGAELRMVTDLLFGVPARFRLGYAHGFGRKGLDAVYFIMAPDP